MFSSMALRWRTDSRQMDDARRWVVGVLVSSDCARLAAAVVAAKGRGLEIRAQVGPVLTVENPPEVVGLFGHLDDPGGGSADSDTVASVASLRDQLASAQASLVTELLDEARIAPARVLAMGVHDPGLWGRTGGFMGLCDPARLAESTGLNVIDAFPARDVVAGGQGGPITALPKWILLRHPNRNRLILDLGRTIRMTYLPADRGLQPASGIVSFEVGPGMRLLDQLTVRLTTGEHRFDPGGRFAVQGRRIPELIDHWLQEPGLKRPLPRWHPRGIRPERFLLDAVQMAVESGWSVQDMLCSATHFLAEEIAVAVRRWLPQDAKPDEIALSGGGQQNGMLLREITARLPELPMLRIEEIGISSPALGPASPAILALLYLDQVPANHPRTTGAEVTRVLGRMTPGSPQSWQRLLQELTGSSPTTLRPLRSAI